MSRARRTVLVVVFSVVVNGDNDGAGLSQLVVFDIKEFRPIRTGRVAERFRPSQHYRLVVNVVGWW